MKAMRKLACLLLVAVMIVAMGVTAFADETPKNDSITVNSAKVGETYNLYKMFNLIVNSETAPTAYSYTINSDWAAFFKAAEGTNPAGAGNQYITVNEAGYVTDISDAEALAKAAAAWSGKPAATQTKKADATTVTFAGLSDGYWLITSTLGTLAMTETTPDAADVTVDEKNPENTVTKVVEEDSTDEYGASNDAQIGDIINFKTTVKIVKGTRNVVVHDKMTSGLTYTAGSVAIAGLTKGTEYTVNENPGHEDETFDITFTQSWIDGLDFGTDGYKEYEITYTATLNENAVVKDANGVAIKNQENTTIVSFGDSTESVESTTTTITHKFNVYKHATDATENLAGAVFSLKKAGTVVPLIKLDDNNYRVANSGEAGAVDTFTTVADSDIVIWGVDADDDDDYSLEEITPPNGYNKLTAEKEVVVAEDNSARVDIENKSGTQLPSTGGIGTTMFYIIGGILVVAAVVLLVTKKRMSAAE